MLMYNSVQVSTHVRIEFWVAMATVLTKQIVYGCDILALRGTPHKQAMVPYEEHCMHRQH